jgi:hypothetical protein
MKAIRMAVVVGGLFVASSAFGQSHNIDFNQTVGAGAGVPAVTYGAAAAQPGSWQPIGSVAANAPIALSGLNGLPSGASFTSLTANPIFGFNNVGTTGDNELLMDDGLDMGGTGATDTFTFTNLQNGTYDLYVYAWAPDSATFITTVNQGGNPVPVGGAWGGGLSAGVTHAVFSGVVVNAGTLQFTTATTSGFSTLNGIQLVLIPSPGALAMLGVAGLVGSRRRRA